MWVIAWVYGDNEWDSFVSSHPGMRTLATGQARKFTLPADAECWIESHITSDQERFKVVKMEAAR